jgi:hypothetical protein
MEGFIPALFVHKNPFGSYQHSSANAVSIAGEE